MDTQVIRLVVSISTNTLLAEGDEEAKAAYQKQRRFQPTPSSRRVTWWSAKRTSS